MVLAVRRFLFWKKEWAGHCRMLQVVGLLEKSEHKRGAEDGVHSMSRMFLTECRLVVVFEDTERLAGR